MTSQTDMRRAAAQNGDKTYFTGVPCKHGHLVARYVTTGGCLECLRPIRRVFPEGDREKVFQPPPILIRDPISREHADLLRTYIVHWAEAQLGAWGYKTWAGGVKIEYEVVPRE
jgi:hypothetical protein